MYKIIDRHTYETSQGYNVDVCDIIADTPESIPTTGDIKSDRIGVGSWCYIISTGGYKVLNSEGVWI